MVSNGNTTYGTRTPGGVAEPVELAAMHGIKRVRTCQTPGFAAVQGTGMSNAGIRPDGAGPTAVSRQPFG